MTYEDFKKKTLVEKDLAHQLALKVNGKMAMLKKDWFTVPEYHKVMMIPYTKEGGERVMYELLHMSRFGLINLRSMNDVHYYQIELFESGQIRNMQNNLKGAQLAVRNLKQQIETLKREINGLTDLESTIRIVLPPEKLPKKQPD